jgi:hypothetical protein
VPLPVRVPAVALVAPATVTVGLLAVNVSPPAVIASDATCSSPSTCIVCAMPTSSAAPGCAPHDQFVPRSQSPAASELQVAASEAVGAARAMPDATSTSSRRMRRTFQRWGWRNTVKTLQFDDLACRTADVGSPAGPPH